MIAPVAALMWVLVENGHRWPGADLAAIYRAPHNWRWRWSTTGECGLGLPHAWAFLSEASPWICPSLIASMELGPHLRFRNPALKMRCARGRRSTANFGRTWRTTMSP